MNKLFFTALALSVASPIVWGSGMDTAHNPIASHQVMVEGPNIVSLDTDAALVATLNKRVDARLQKAMDELNSRVDQKVELSLR